MHKTIDSLRGLHCKSNASLHSSSFVTNTKLSYIGWSRSRINGQWYFLYYYILNFCSLFFIFFSLFSPCVIIFLAFRSLFYILPCSLYIYLFQLSSVFFYFVIYVFFFFKYGILLYVWLFLPSRGFNFSSICSSSYHSCPNSTIICFIRQYFPYNPLFLLPHIYESLTTAYFSFLLESAVSWLSLCLGFISLSFLFFRFLSIVLSFKSFRLSPRRSVE